MAHISLNAGGGAERLSVFAIRALSDLGIAVDLSTFERPDPRIMVDAYGETLENRIRNVRSLRVLSSLLHPVRSPDADIHINTHGDMLPLFHEGFSRTNSIVYCHFPIAGCLLDGDDRNYRDLLVNVSTSHMTTRTQSQFLEMAKKAYDLMLAHSTVLTNSQFSRRAILRLHGVDSTVLYPPVETQKFGTRAFSLENVRDPDVLVVSRFHRTKKIENAIRLASLLKRRSAIRRMVIVGNMAADGIAYFHSLKKLAGHYGIGGFVKFEPNGSFERLFQLMSRCKVYLHPLPGEPFGMSTVESMSAGLIPVVPDVGGHTEFVPKMYQFHTYDQGVDAVMAALDAPASEHLLMNRSAANFSVGSFVDKFKKLVTDLLGHEGIPATLPLVSKRIHKDSIA